MILSNFYRWLSAQWSLSPNIRSEEIEEKEKIQSWEEFK